jgi:iron complex transport system ATP-binding protein
MIQLEARACSLHLGRLAQAPTLEDVTCGLRSGELVGIIGPNGAGKSTLTRALAGLLPSSAIFLNDRPLKSLSAAERARKVAYLAQSTPTPWPMSAWDVVSLGRLPHRDGHLPQGHAAIAKALEQVKAWPFAKRPLDRLSGGERARIALARALAVEAPILLADEPIAHLDPAHQLQTLSLLRARADGGDAVMVVLHDLSLTARFCDRVLIICQGRVIADGAPDEVMEENRLRQVFGISTARGTWNGDAFLLPWGAAS